MQEEEKIIAQKSFLPSLLFTQANIIEKLLTKKDCEEGSRNTIETLFQTSFK